MLRPESSRTGCPKPTSCVRSARVSMARGCSLFRFQIPQCSLSRELFLFRSVVLRLRVAMQRRPPDPPPSWLQVVWRPFPPDVSGFHALVVGIRAAMHPIPLDFQDRLEVPHRPLSPAVFCLRVLLRGLWVPMPGRLRGPMLWFYAVPACAPLAAPRTEMSFPR